MPIDFKKTQAQGHTPEIWRGECKILPAGFKPVQNFPIGTTLHRGTPLFVDFEAMSAAVCKTAKVLAGGTTTAPRVAKGHYFVVGDVVMKLGTTDKSPIIKSIDTTNSDYDVITLQSAITGLAAEDILVEASEYVAAGDGTEAVPAAPLYTPNMIVGAVKEFNGKGLPTIDAAYEAVVLYPSLCFPIPDEWLIGGMKPCLKSNPNILFIKQ